jgi:hypothetical protein
VLDIAGGKGELSFELLNLNQIPSTVIDPRPLDLTKFQRRLAFGLYARKGWQEQEAGSSNQISHTNASPVDAQTPQHFRLFFLPALWNSLLVEESPGADLESFEKLLGQWKLDAKSIAWTDKGLVTHEEGETEEEQEDQEGEGELPEIESRQQEPSKCVHHTSDALIEDEEEDEQRVSVEQVRDALRFCSAVVGLHPDQAAEPLVDFALQWKKPFAVVPCCTYAKDFPGRRLRSGKEVKSYEDLLAYLVEKDPEHIRVVTLPFGGKNQCVYASDYSSH